MFNFFKKKNISGELSILAATIINFESACGVFLNTNPMDDPMVFVKLWAAKIIQNQLYEKSLALVLHHTNFKGDDACDYLINFNPKAFSLWDMQTRYRLADHRETCIEIYVTRYGDTADKQLKNDISEALLELNKKYSIR